MKGIQHPPWMIFGGSQKEPYYNLRKEIGTLHMTTSSDHANALADARADKQLWLNKLGHEWEGVEVVLFKGLTVGS